MLSNNKCENIPKKNEAPAKKKNNSAKMILKSTNNKNE